MKTKFIIDSPEGFDRWIQEQQATAQENLNQAVALNSAEMSPAQFLAPYTQNMGIGSETLAQLHAHHHQ